MKKAYIYNQQNLVIDIQTAIKQEFGVEQSVSFFHTKDMSKGDLTTTVALGKLGKNPFLVAQKIVARIQALWLDRDTAQPDPKETISKIEAVRPGFINVWFSNKYLQQINNGFIETIPINFSQTKNHRVKKIIIEFTDPNPFKEFHIGHLYSNIVGEAISRLREALGHEVKRACYQGDVGMHVAKSIWGMKHKIAEEFGQKNLADALRDLGFWPLKKRIQLLGAAYALGATKFGESLMAKQEITKINQLVYQTAVGVGIGNYQAPDLNQSQGDIALLYQTGREWSLEYFDNIYSRLGMQFDFFFFESQVGKVGEKIVRQYLARGIFENSQGAIVFPGKKYGLHDRVFINSLGLPTYEAKELGLAPTKYAQYAYDESIIITGNEIDEYFKVLLKAISQTHPDLAAKTSHLSHGMVRLPEGKMSSRTGKVITGEWLLDQATTLMKERMLTSHPDMEPAKQAKIASIIALGAVKYALLKSNIGDDVIFSFDQSLSFAGNSGPYLQYTALRCLSVWQKALIDLATDSISLQKDILSNNKIDCQNIYTSLDIDTLRYFARYYDVVTVAAEKSAPHQLATYLYNLAKQLNSWYDSEKIINFDSDQLTKSSFAKLGIAKSGYEITRHGLNILGISIPEEM